LNAVALNFDFGVGGGDDEKQVLGYQGLKEYKKRAGIEGMISQGVRAFRMRRSRYIGRAKSHLQHLATAAAINLERVADWFAGVGCEKTRTSAFARVMIPLVAPS